MTDKEVQHLVELGSFIALMVAAIGGYWWWFIPLIVFLAV